MNAAVARVRGNKSLFILHNFFPPFTPMSSWMPCYFTKSFPTNRRRLAGALRHYRKLYGFRGFPEALNYRIFGIHLRILNTTQQAADLAS